MTDAESEPEGCATARPDEVVFVRDIATGRVTWSPAFAELFGYAPADIAPTVEWWAERLHPEDRERVLQVVRGAHNGHLIAAEYRLRRADGTYADVLGQAYALNEASGAPAIAIGSIRDASASARPTRDELGHMTELFPDATVAVDERGAIALANRQAVALFGYGREELVGLPVEALVPRASRDRHPGLRAAYQAHPTTRPMGSGRDLAARHRDGREIPVDISLSAVESSIGPLTIATVRDLSEHVRKDEALRRQIRHVRLLRSVAAAANEATSADAALQAAIDQICAVMGWPVGHVFLPAADGTRLLPTAIWHLADAERYRELTEVTAATEFARGTGLPGRVLAEARPLFVPDIASASLPRGAAAVRAGLRSAFLCAVTLGTEVAAVLEFFSAEPLAASAELLEVMADVGAQLGHVIERDRARSATIHLALHDALTDLPNRHLLGDRLAQAIAVARRDRRSVGLLFIDLDDFKVVNDTLGHAAGDAALREVAARLRAALREQDTVARVGGDEFAVVLPHTDTSGAVDAARKVRQALDPALLVEGQRCHVSASVGIAIYPLHSEDEFALVRHADVALYSAKRAGTGFAVYDAKTDEYTRERLALADELRRGIEDGQLICHYQPEVCLRTGNVVGVESLVRWRHPELGLLPPADFVPLAERTGLVGALTRRVLDDAVARARAWERGGRPLVVAVNVSARDVLDPEMPDIVGAAVGAAGLRPDLLRLEITETQLLTDPDRAVRNLEALRRHGVRLALDDFGAGYASLGYLRRLPIDQLKVDGSLVADMAHDRASASIVRAALALGTDLGLEVIAEGIEDDATRERLVALGYDCGQGYGLARPMTHAELATWLRGRTIASA